MRRIPLKVNGLNIITGRSSTGKSSLSEIVEYCMGRSTFNIPEGTIRDKVAWYAVIYQFSGEQVLIAKPAPEKSAASCSKVMIRRGSLINPPPFYELIQNADDDTVVSLLSELLGIPDNRTQVPQDKSRDSFKATIQHTYFYLFQKQTLIANKDQLFYRQNEQFMPQAIKDTLPILLGAINDKQIEIDYKLRIAKRDLKIAQKQFTDYMQFSDQVNDRALGLLSEAQQVGILSRSIEPKTTNDALVILTKLSKWKPTPIPDEDINRITELEDEISAIRKKRLVLNESLQAANLFVEKEDGLNLTR